MALHFPKAVMIYMERDQFIVSIPTFIFKCFDISTNFRQY